MSLTQVPLDADMLSRLDAAAASLSLSREDALRQAVEGYLDDISLRAEVAAGRAAVERGDVYPSEEVEAYFAKKREQLRVKLAV